MDINASLLDLASPQQFYLSGTISYKHTDSINLIRTSYKFNHTFTPLSLNPILRGCRAIKIVYDELLKIFLVLDSSGKICIGNLVMVNTEHLELQPINDKNIFSHSFYMENNMENKLEFIVDFALTDRYLFLLTELGQIYFIESNELLACTVKEKTIFTKYKTNIKSISSNKYACYGITEDKNIILFNPKSNNSEKDCKDSTLSQPNLVDFIVTNFGYCFLKTEDRVQYYAED